MPSTSIVAQVFGSTTEKPWPGTSMRPVVAGATLGFGFAAAAGADGDAAGVLGVAVDALSRETDGPSLDYGAGYANRQPVATDGDGAGAPDDVQAPASSSAAARAAMPRRDGRGDAMMVTAGGAGRIIGGRSEW